VTPDDPEDDTEDDADDAGVADADGLAAGGFSTEGWI
jgi:hypothetical protein